MSSGRPRPVIIAMSVLAGLQAVTAAAGFADAVPPQVALWAVLAVAGVQAAVQFMVQNAVTPVADPRAADGTPLVPQRLGAGPDRFDPLDPGVTP